MHLGTHEFTYKPIYLSVFFPNYRDERVRAGSSRKVTDKRKLSKALRYIYGDKKKNMRVDLKEK
jgi:hypothetical protein